MKRFYNIALSLACSFMLASCEENEALDFHVDKPASFAMQEQIDAYKPLKSYINREANSIFKLGAGVSLSQYIQKGVVYRLVNSNFDEITAGYEMKHGAVVKADGSLNLANVTTFLEAASKAGISVYGHTLAWHANQNATYLKSLIAPLVVTSPGFNNDLSIAGLQNGTFTGWTKANAGAGIIVEDNKGMGAGTKAIKLVSSASSASANDLQLISPAINVVSGKTYEVIMYIKSDVAGEGRIAFEGLANALPKVDWAGTGTATETFTTGISWKKIKVQASGISGNSIKLHFDLGYKPNVTYYIDVNNLYVYDTQGTAIVTNLVTEGNFETGSGWGGWGGSSTRGVTAAGLGYGSNSKALFVTNPKKESGFWVVQTSYSFGKTLTPGDTYEISLMVKGTAAGTLKAELQSVTGTPTRYNSNSFGDIPVTTDWQRVTRTVTVNGTDAEFRDRLVFSYGDYVGTVYIDDVVVKNTKSAGTSTEVVKTASEKESIVGSALETWIKGMVTATKSYVKVWDVVNEPMDDAKPAELKTAAGRTTIAADEFFWQDYLGKDYAVKAFKLARQYGNATDIHFINDYNLEFSLSKCRGLIDYVNYIESQGAKVDGIGTQMHINTNSDKEKIAEMFRLLAATGKLIKVSELDMGMAGGVKTPQATQADYEAQKEMYRYVVEKYFELIPAAQRYGITIWSPQDSPASSSWRAGEPIGLWTEGFVRKPAYVGVAEALSKK